MADISDVFASIIAIIQDVIYPTGTGNPSPIKVNNTPIVAIIYPGWPIPANLDADLAAGKINISVYAPRDRWRNTTRYEANWVQSTYPNITLSTAVVPGGTQITLAGTIAVPQNVAVLCNGRGVSVGVLVNDTLATVATRLAAKVTAEITSATAVGPVITIPAALSLGARVGGVAKAVREVLRQEAVFQVTYWCPSPSHRDAVAPPVKVALAGYTFLTLADNTAAKIDMSNDYFNDDAQKPTLYRRDCFYTVEYATNEEMTAVEIVVGEVKLYGGIDPANQPLIADVFY